MNTRLFNSLFFWLFLTGFLFFLPQHLVMADGYHDIVFKKIGSVSDYVDTYQIILIIKTETVVLGEKDCSPHLVEDLKDRISLNLDDVTLDGPLDYIVNIKVTRGSSDLFYVVNGENLELIFSSETCRENMDFGRMGTEGRGGREFTCGAGYVIEKITIPVFDLSTGNFSHNKIEIYRYYWSEENGFVLTSTEERIE